MLGGRQTRYLVVLLFHVKTCCPRSAHTGTSNPLEPNLNKDPGTMATVDHEGQKELTAIPTGWSSIKRRLSSAVWMVRSRYVLDPDLLDYF